MDKEKAPTPADSLTPMNRLFLFYMTHGDEQGNKLSVFAAYQKAGGEGDKHAAYQMKSRLEKELTAEAINTGMAKSDIVRDIAALNSLPVVGADGKPVMNVSVKEKLRLSSLALRVHEAIQEKTPNITAIQINRYDSGKKDEVIVETTAVRDVTPEDKGE